MTKHTNNPLRSLRAVRGEAIHTAKLCENDILVIREIVEYRNKLRAELSAITNKSLAVKYDVHQRTIDKVTSGFTWGHI
jgi:hypothetical protein